MIDKIKKYCEQNKLFHKVDGMVVGVSGGADSICLLEVLYSLQEEYGYKLRAVHIHHGLRGKEADSDEIYVKEFCSMRSIPLQVYHFDIKALAKEKGMSEEEVGRHVRYSCFHKALAHFNNGMIAVAHHQDDQAETVLHHLLRGSGLKGLGAMRPKRQRIIRPLLSVGRQEIENFLDGEGIAYQTDASNFESIYTRNKIRLELIPYLKKHFNPNIIASLNRTADLLQQDEDYLNIITKDAYDACVQPSEKGFLVNGSMFNTYHRSIKTRILRMIFLEGMYGLKDLSYDHIDNIISLFYKETGKRVHLPRQLMAEKNYEGVQIYKYADYEKGKIYHQIHDLPTKIKLEELGKSFLLEKQLIEQVPLKVKNHYTKCFDYDKIVYNLTLRTRQPGDYIYLKGLKGKKKLKNFFIDQKIPRDQRDDILLLADGSEIVWIIGYRENYKYRITDETKAYLGIKIFHQA